MTKTIDIILYPKFTQEDLIKMLQLRPSESITLSNGNVASIDRRGSIVEIEIQQANYEVDE